VGVGGLVFDVALRACSGLIASGSRSSLLKLRAGRLPVAPLGRSRAAARNSLGGRSRPEATRSAWPKPPRSRRATERGDGQAGADCIGAATVQD